MLIFHSKQITLNQKELISRKYLKGKCVPSGSLTIGCQAKAFSCHILHGICDVYIELTDCYLESENKKKGTIT